MGIVAPVRMLILKVAVAVVVLVGALSFCVRFVPVGHWGFAVAVNFLFMMFFTVVDLICSPSYASVYFAARPFERNGAIYRWFGVDAYRWMLRRIGWEAILRNDLPIRKDLESLSRYEGLTRASEAIHLAAAASVAVVTVWVAWRHSVAVIGWLVLVNILVNVYPVLLQRSNRPRVRRVIERWTQRSAAVAGH
jgi:hypothetical protein